MWHSLTINTMKIQRQTLRRKSYKSVWAKLIHDFGYSEGSNKCLQCFDICTKYGIDLDGSTIDEVVLLPDGQIRFFYNKNTGDYDSIDRFTYKGLRKFYNKFVTSYNKDVEYVLMENYSEGKDL